MNPTVIQGLVGDDPPEARLYYGLNVLDALRLLPDNSVNMVATSPPYWGLRNYGVPPSIWGGDPECEHEWGDDIDGPSQSGGTGKSTLGSASGGNSISEEGVQRTLMASHAESLPSAFCTKCGAWRGCLGLEPTPQLFAKNLTIIGREVRRVLHPTGTLWLNLGDSYMSATANDISNLGGIEGGHMQKNSEYGAAILFGKKSVEGLKYKDKVMVPHRVALALQDDGWWVRNDIIWRKKNAMPTSVQDRFACKFEYVFLLAQSRFYFFDLDAVKVPHTYGKYDEDGNFTPAQQWFESGEGDRKMDQTEGEFGALAGSPRREGRGLYNVNGKNPGDVWDLATSSYPGAHFAVWPPKLVERMILAGSSEKGRCPHCKAPWERIKEKRRKGKIKKLGTRNLTGDRKTSQVHGVRKTAGPQDYDRLKLEGSTVIVADETETVGWRPICDCPEHEPERCVVMDIFSGSATTGMVAMKLGRNYIGLDLNGKYLPLAEARLTGRKAPQKDDEPDLIGGLFG